MTPDLDASSKGQGTGRRAIEPLGIDLHLRNLVTCLLSSFTRHLLFALVCVVKKACANCSCGRGELEAQHGVEKAQEMIRTGEVESKCGNCFLGDDYRCEGCPFRGQPAFKPGEKLEIVNTPDL